MSKRHFNLLKIIFIGFYVYILIYKEKRYVENVQISSVLVFLRGGDEEKKVDRRSGGDVTIE